VSRKLQELGDLSLRVVDGFERLEDLRSEFDPAWTQILP
jgi:hypothetical protein